MEIIKHETSCNSTFIIFTCFSVCCYRGISLYYSSLQKSAFQEAERQAIMHAERIKKNLASFLSANIRPAKALAGMRERAGLVGGVLEVQSQPGKGTRVNFIVPVDGQAGAVQ